MLQIRPAWHPTMRPIWGMLPHAVHTLLDAEWAATEHLRLAIQAARETPLAGGVDGAADIADAARLDLIAGVELARAGYLRQACVLWRSWLEQTLFALYFIEAPLHRLAWRSSDQIDLGKPPTLKLMLHQILTSVGDAAHPFGLVYAERCQQFFDALRINPPKDLQPLRVVAHRLSDLSQAAHGTYRPVPVAHEDDVARRLAAELLDLFSSTVTVVGFLWFICVQAALDVNAEQLIAMRDPAFQPNDVSEQLLAPLLPQLRQYLGSLKGNKK